MRGSFTEFIVVLAVIAIFLLVYGAKKIPELAKALKESKDILVDEEEDKSEGEVIETTASEKSE